MKGVADYIIQNRDKKNKPIKDCIWSNLFHYHIVY